MLVLSRNPGQAIILGENVKIIYLGNNGGHQVRFGIEAPEDIKVWREEIWLRMNCDKQPIYYTTHKLYNDRNAANQ